MPEIVEAAHQALALLLGLDAVLFRTVGLSLAISVTASLAAAAIGLPLGTALAAFRCPGRGGVILLANALLGLPPVVVGLVLYLLLSRSGPLGTLGLLFTPAAMVAAQFLLAVPIVTALSHRAMDGIQREYRDELVCAGASRMQVLYQLLSIGRREAMTAALAGFGRSISEVGAILIVGGNIAGYTRTMTTAITLETGRGNLALALALGAILVSITIVVSAGILGFAGRAR